MARSDVEARTNIKQSAFFRDTEDVFSLFDSTFEGIIIHDKGAILDVNPAFAKMVGWDRDELIGASGFELIADDSLDAVENHITSGYLEVYEAALRQKDGTIFQVEIAAKEVSRDGGKIRITAVRDITERKRAEAELRESEKRFRVLVEASSECICKIDLEGRFLYMSPAGLKSHGFSKQSEIINLACTELAEPEYQTLLEQSLTQAKKGLTQKIEYESGTAQGTRWFESVVTPERNGLGEIIGFIRLSRDITDRKRAEQKVSESWDMLRRTLKGVVGALSSTAGMRDPYTADHQKRVAKLAATIAKELGLNDEQCEGVGVAGTLHDIGKIYVPAEILSKPGTLNEFEFKIIQAHAQASYDILKGIDFPWPVAQTVLQHHERLDGTGYPGGLTDEEIIIEAKILGVADVVEAMWSRRPYRAGLGLERALKEISQNAGRLYDKDVANVCLDLFIKQKFDFRNAHAEF